MIDNHENLKDHRRMSNMIKHKLRTNPYQATLHVYANTRRDCK